MIITQVITIKTQLRQFLSTILLSTAKQTWLAWLFLLFPYLSVAQPAAQENLAPTTQPHHKFKLSVDSDVTFSDNINLSSTDKKSGNTLRIEPTLFWHQKSSRVQADVDLGIAAFTGSEPSSNSTQVRLNADLHTNFLQNTLLFDVSSRVSEQSRSAFSPVLPYTQADTTDSLTQTRYISAGVGYQNRFLYDWNYNASYKTSYSEDSKNITANTRTQTVSALVGNRNSARKLYTELRASGNHTEPENLNSYETGLTQIEFGWRPFYGLNTFVSTGKEYNGYLVENRSSTTYDAGFNWQPSRRSNLNASVGHRYYGSTHNINLNYRTPLTQWQLSSTKSAIHTENQFALPVGISTEELLQQSENPQLLASQIYNRFGRIPATLILPINVLSDTYTLDQTTQLNVSLLGTRNVTTFTAFRKESSIINGISSGSQSLGAFGTRIIQIGYSLNWNHQLNTRNSLGTSYAWLHNRALTTEADMITRTLGLNYRYLFNKTTSTSLALRHYLSNDAITHNKITENAIIATLHTEF